MSDAPRIQESDIRIELAPKLIAVVNDEGRLIGSATLSFVDGAAKLHLMIDPQNPEVFDLETEPRRVFASLEATIFENIIFAGSVTLTSK